MLSPFYSVRSDDFEVNQLQDSLSKALKPVFTNNALDCVLLPGVSLTTGSNDVSHKLGRTLLGWFLVRQRAQAQIWDSQDTNKAPDKTLTLNATANVVVDLYVF